MKKFNLYVTDWAPNGTNDLLVCDEDHQIVDVVEEATFGIDVAKCIATPGYVLVADDQSVFPIREAEAKGVHGCELCFVGQIDEATLRRRLCVSPVDPRGIRVLEALVEAGVDIGIRYCSECDAVEEK